MKRTRPPRYLVIEGSPFDNPVKLKWAPDSELSLIKGARMKKARHMQQILLRESELGRRYTALGSFSKSADLKSLFTVNLGACEPITEGSEMGSVLAENTPELRLMWHRLSALACAPMQATGADSLLALAGSRRAARVHSRYGKRKPANATPTATRGSRLLSVWRLFWDGSEHGHKFGK